MTVRCPKCGAPAEPTTGWQPHHYCPRCKLDFLPAQDVAGAGLYMGDIKKELAKDPPPRHQVDLSIDFAFLTLAVGMLIITWGWPNKVFPRAVLAASAAILVIKLAYVLSRRRRP
jgi:hypothetical protein